jgi:hypothetical protein
MRLRWRKTVLDEGAPHVDIENQPTFRLSSRNALSIGREAWHSKSDE